MYSTANFRIIQDRGVHHPFQIISLKKSVHSFTKTTFQLYTRTLQSVLNCLVYILELVFIAVFLIKTCLCSSFVCVAVFPDHVHLVT
jgi:hypothetical protein